MMNNRQGNKGDLAYVFDIDGVFLKGGSLIPKSKEAFQLVKKREVPYIFLSAEGRK